MEPTGDLGIDVLLLPLPPPPSSLARWQRSPPEGSPFCWVSSTHKKGIQGSSMGRLAFQSPSPRHRARISRNHSVFSFLLFFSQLLRKTCPENHPQQPSLTPAS